MMVESSRLVLELASDWCEVSLLISKSCLKCSPLIVSSILVLQTSLVDLTGIHILRVPFLKQYKRTFAPGVDGFWSCHSKEYTYLDVLCAGGTFLLGVPVLLKYRVSTLQSRRGRLRVDLKCLDDSVFYS